MRGYILPLAIGLSLAGVRATSADELFFEEDPQDRLMEKRDEISALVCRGN